MRLFVEINVGKEPVPDETTIYEFRHLMEKNNLGDELFCLVNIYRAENGLKVNRGTIVADTIINAPSRPRIKISYATLICIRLVKGTNGTLVCRRVSVMTAKPSRSTLLSSLPRMSMARRYWAIYCMEMKAMTGAIQPIPAYTGQKETLYQDASAAKEFTQKKGSRHRQLTTAEGTANRHKTKIHSRVEHVFTVIKRRFGINKVRYHGLIKMHTVSLQSVY